MYLPSNLFNELESIWPQRTKCFYSDEKKDKFLSSFSYVSFCRKSREENLQQFISEKEGKIVELKREYVQLDEKLNSTERQVESIEATIGHYHDIKR